MSNEKIPAFYVSDDPYEEKRPKYKYCSRSIIIWVLAALLIALGLALCVEFLYPFAVEHKLTDVEVVHVYDEDKKTIEVQENNPATTNKIISKTPLPEPWHLDFLINPTRLCDTMESPNSEAYRKNPEVKLLVLVQSPTSHFEERETIRKTWGSIAEKPHGTTRLGFVLGTTPNTTEEAMISKESELHGDIIQADFQDTRFNLTTKSILMLKWVSKYCPHAQYVLKTNDETFVNLTIITQILKRDSLSPNDKFIGGFIQKGEKPPTQLEEEYSFEMDYDEKLPPFASGPSYITNGPTASKLFETSKLVKPLLPIDDIFITGLCADQIAASLIHEPSFRHEQLTKPLKFDELSSFATIHGVSPTDMDHLWNTMNNIISDVLNLDTDKLFSAPFGNKPLSNFFDQWIRESEKFLVDDDDWLESNFGNWNPSEARLNKLDKAPKIKTNIDIFGWISDQPNPGTQSKTQFGPGIWPYDVLKKDPLQKQEGKFPITWQKSFVIPIPLNRGRNNDFNITHMLGF